MLRVVLLIVAVVAGGAAAWIGFRMKGEPAPVITVVQPELPAAMPEVLVAAAGLGIGQALNKDNMRWQSWPQSAIVPGYIVRSLRPEALDTLTNSFVRSRMSSGEPIRDEKLVPTNAGFLSTLLPAGKRAVAVRISVESSAGGFVLPNDRVDVLLTTASAGKADHSTRAILRNVPVLAIDQAVDDRIPEEKSKGKGKVAAIGKTATLELEPPQVEILVAGEATGTLSLALRSAADNAERAPPTRLQSSQSVRRFKVGSIDVVEIVTSKTAVETPGTHKALGPSWTPGQVAPVKQQARQNPSGGVLQ